MAREPDALPRLHDEEEERPEDGPTKVGAPPLDLVLATARVDNEETTAKHRSGVRPVLHEDVYDEEPTSRRDLRASDIDLSPGFDPVRDAETLEVSNDARAAIVAAVDARAKKKSDARFWTEIALASLAVAAILGAALFWLFD